MSPKSRFPCELRSSLCCCSHFCKIKLWQGAFCTWQSHCGVNSLVWKEENNFLEFKWHAGLRNEQNYNKTKPSDLL